MSAGGEFNYEFVAWKPERVIAFVVNKGGIYYTALAEEPGAAHIVGRSRDVAIVFYEDVLSARLRGSALGPIDERSGFIGDLKAKTWQAMVTEKPFGQ